MSISRPHPESLYGILRKHACKSLYVPPICWTDEHSRLLGVRFNCRPSVNEPAPVLPPGVHLEPSEFAKDLSSQLDILLREGTTPIKAKCAMQRIFSALFPSNQPKSGAELNLHFGNSVFRKTIHIPCVWSCPKMPTTSSNQADVGIPILAYINRSQLAASRRNLYPDALENAPVSTLHHLRLKKLQPADANHDPYIVAVLLAMAQAHFYHDSLDTVLSSFRDIAIRVITHDERSSSFIVYSAVVTATWLDRFMSPYSAPKSQEDFTGIEILYAQVDIWPLIGLKERLSKVLGPEIAGVSISSDPNYIGLWDQLVKPQSGTVSLKRRREEKEPLPQVDLPSRFGPKRRKRA